MNQTKSMEITEKALRAGIKRALELLTDPDSKSWEIDANGCRFNVGFARNQLSHLLDLLPPDPSPEDIMPTEARGRKRSMNDVTTKHAKYYHLELQRYGETDKDFRKRISSELEKIRRFIAAFEAKLNKHIDPEKDFPVITNLTHPSKHGVD